MYRLIALVFVAWCLTTSHNIALAQGVPQQAGPLGIKPTAAEVELGRKLFFDPRLSADGSVACATCHNPKLGWADGLRVAIGIRGQAGTRHTPTIINASYSPLMFWDGRTVGQITQALLPLSNPVEMGQQTEAQVVQRLSLNRGYVAMFADVYGIDISSGNPITGPRLAKAIASFQSCVISFDAPVDRYLAGQTDALSPDALIGFNLFREFKCNQCHPAPLYTDNLVHNNGMEFASKLRVTDNGMFDDLAKRGVDRDLLIRSGTVRAFKTPPLRNLRYTAPYNHAGTFDTIKRCVQHYNLGGANSRNQRDRYIDRRIQPRNATDSQIDYLTLFLYEGLAGIDYPLIEEPPLP